MLNPVPNIETAIQTFNATLHLKHLKASYNIAIYKRITLFVLYRKLDNVQLDFNERII